LHTGKLLCDQDHTEQVFPPAPWSQYWQHCITLLRETVRFPGGPFRI